MIDLLLIDDHRIFRTGLVRLLSDEEGIKVGAEAGSWNEAVNLLRSRSFDLVTLDISLDGRSGLDLLAHIRAGQKQLPVLMLSMYPAEQMAKAAMNAGAKGYLSKDSDPVELIRAIRLIAAGGTYGLDGSRDETRSPAHYKLSSRELEVLAQIAMGLSQTEIGERMCLSVKTISTYRSRILEKLDLSSTAELVRYAARHGIGAMVC